MKHRYRSPGLWTLHRRNALAAAGLAAALLVAAPAAAEPEVIEAAPPAEGAAPPTAVEGEPAPAVTREAEASLFQYLLGSAVWLNAKEEYRFRRAEPFSLSDADNSALRTTKSGEDQDIRLSLDGGLTEPDGAFGLDASLGLWLDVNGIKTARSPRSFASVRDDPSGADLDVYTLAARYAGGGWLHAAKAGRFSADYGVPVVIDGASVAFKPFHGDRLSQPQRASLELFLLGGRTVHFYELDDDLAEDWIGAAGARFLMSERLKVEAEYRFLVEDSAEQEVDHLYGVTAWYRHDSGFLARLRARALDDQFADVGLRTRWESEAWRLGANATVNVQTATFNQLAEQEDPYFTILGESKPRARWLLDTWKSVPTLVGELTFHVGWNGREPIDGPSEPFNRSFGRLYFTSEADDLFVAGLYATATVDYSYDGMAFDEGLFSVGGAVGYKADWIGGEAGSYYQRFKYTYYQDVDEIENVRTVYGSAFVLPWPWLRLKAKYEYERVDRDIHTATFSLRQSWEVAP